MSLLVLLSGLVCCPKSHASVDDEIAFNEGLVYYESGDYGAAKARFESLSVTSPAAQTYIALCASQLNPVPAPTTLVGKETDSSLVYDETLACSDGAECGAGVTCGSACAERARPWHLTLLTAYQYDSNVTLEPEFAGLGSGRGIADSSWIVAAFGDYQVIAGPSANLGIIGSAYTNQYFEANEFDAQDYMLGGYTNWLVSDVLLAGIRYEFHESLLDYSEFAQQHRLVPNLTLLEGEFGHSTFYYELEGQDFRQPPLIPALDRSGHVNSIGATQAIYTWQGLGRIFFGYRHDWADTDGSDFDRQGDMVTGRIERPLLESCVADFEVRQFWDDYEFGNSLDFFGQSRSDNRTEVRGGLQYFWNDHISLRADYTFINSNSNTANLFGVRFYDYDRHLFSTQLIYDF
jgi:hypothetical protein